MKLHRTTIAFVLTAIWIAGGIVYAYFMRGAFFAMKPQQFAEFLAGAFSPLAFLWLIVGYMQQGEELKQNTLALRQQAEELKLAAKQQGLLVEVTREQLAQERTNIEQERERIQSAAEPMFLLGTIGSPVAGQSGFPVRVANSGGVARALSLFVVSPDETEIRVFTVPVVETGDTHDFNLPLDVVQRARLRFSFRDMFGTPGSKTFDVRFGENNGLVFTRLTS